MNTIKKDIIKNDFVKKEPYTYSFHMTPHLASTNNDVLKEIVEIIDGELRKQPGVQGWYAYPIGRLVYFDAQLSKGTEFPIDGIFQYLDETSRANSSSNFLQFTLEESLKVTITHLGPFGDEGSRKKTNMLGMARKDAKKLKANVEAETKRKEEKVPQKDEFLPTPKEAEEQKQKESKKARKNFANLISQKAGKYVG